MTNVIVKTPSASPQKFIFWKESRLLAPLWLTIMLVFIGVTAVSAAMFARGSLEAFVRINIVSCCAFALLAGISMFAFERENKTDQFLANLPVNGSVVFRSKFLIGLAAMMLFVVVASAITWITFSQIQNGFLSQESRFEYLGSSVLLPLECYAASVLMSLLFRRILSAVIASMVFVFVIVITTSMAVFASLAGAPATKFYISAFVIRIGILILVTGTAMLGGRRWLRGFPSQSTNRSDHIKLLTSKPQANPRSRTYKSLLWQSLHQQVVFYLLAVATYFVGFINIHFWNERFLFGLGSISFALGICTFASDQFQNRFRFFQQHGIKPRRVWLARVTPMLLFLAVLTTIVLVSIVSSNSSDWARLGDGFEHSLLLSILLCYSIGQFSSIHFRSIVFAILFGFIACMFATYFGVTLVRDFSVDPWIMAMPMTVGLLLATWFKANSWITERHTISSNIRSFCIVLTTICLILTAAGYVRWNSVAALDGTSFEKIKERHQQLVAGNTLTGVYDDEPNAVDAARMFIRALAVFKPRDGRDDEKFVAANHKALKLLYSAAETSLCYPFLDPTSIASRRQSRQQLTDLLVASAKLKTAEGDLATALKSHMALLQISRHRPLAETSVDIQPMLDWSVETGQTSELIQKAITISQQAKQTIDWYESFTRPDGRTDPATGQSLAEHYSKLDWENGGWAQQLPIEESLGVFSDLGSYLLVEFPWEKSRRRGPVYHAIDNVKPAINSLAPTGYTQASPLFRQIVNTDQSLRYLIVRLKLEAYRLDNGEYPHDFAAFNAEYRNMGQWFTDSYSHGDFVYKPNGTKHDAVWDFEIIPVAPLTTKKTTSQTVNGHIPKGVPFLLPWSKLPDSNTIQFYLPGDPPDAKAKTGLDFSPSTDSKVRGSDWDFDFRLQHENKAR